MSWFMVRIEGEVVGTRRVTEAYAQAIAIRCGDVCGKLSGANAGIPVMKISTTYETSGAEPERVDVDEARVKIISRDIKEALDDTSYEKYKMQQELIKSIQPLEEQLTLAIAAAQSLGGETAKALNNSLKKALHRAKTVETNLREVIETL